MVKKLLILASACLLASCGGGGGNPAPATSEESLTSAFSSAETSVSSHSSEVLSSSEQTQSSSSEKVQSSSSEQTQSSSSEQVESSSADQRVSKEEGIRVLKSAIEKNKALDKIKVDTTGAMDLDIDKKSGQSYVDFINLEIPEIVASYAGEGLSIFNNENIKAEDLKQLKLAAKADSENVKFNLKRENKEGLIIEPDGKFGYATYVKDGVVYINSENLQIDYILSEIFPESEDVSLIAGLFRKIKIDPDTIQIKDKSLSEVIGSFDFGMLNLFSGDYSSMSDLLSGDFYDELSEYMDFVLEGSKYVGSVAINYDNLAKMTFVDCPCETLEEHKQEIMEKIDLDENSAISVSFDENNIFDSFFKIKAASKIDIDDSVIEGAKKDISGLPTDLDFDISFEPVKIGVDVNLKNTYSLGEEVKFPRNLGTYTDITTFVDAVTEILGNLNK
ncbi:MAG: hypothetical protein SPL00_03065 [Bacilli bacterium]|nr:hypothetical protein [Bacilli bacterium]